MSLPAISVVVPARDSASTLPATLDSLTRQQVGEPFEVIVVDDASSDDTGALAHAAGVRVIDGPGRGAAEARNAGVAASSAPLLAFTDADCRPRPDWLARGLGRLLAGAELVQGRVVAECSADETAFARRFHVEGDAGLHETANLFVTRAAFDRVGGFERVLDDSGGRPMGEDTWFGWRVRRSGSGLEFAPDAVVEHAVQSRSGVDFVREHRRLALMPELVRLIPELRGTLMFGRIFLSARTAAFDFALASAVIAAVRRSQMASAGLLPYLLFLCRDGVPFGRWGVRVAAIRVAADGVGFASLLMGSLRTRTPVI